MSTSPPAPAKPRRTRRRLLGALVIAAVSLPVALAGVSETSWFERRVSALASEHGVSLSWRSLRCTWRDGHCTWRGLTVEFDGLRASLDRLSLTWAWRPLLRSHLEVSSLDASGVLVERFASSKSPETAAPLSGALDILKTTPSLELQRLTVEALAVRWPIGARALELDHLHVDGKALLGPEVAPSVDVRLSGGEARVLEAGALRLEVALALQLRAALDDTRLSISCSSAVTHSTPAWPLPEPGVLELDAQLNFLPEARRVDLSLGRLSALGHGLIGTATASLPDDGAPQLEKADVTATLHPLLPLLRHFEPSLELEAATAHLAAQGTALDATLQLGRLAVRGVALETVALTAQLTPHDGTARLKARTVTAGPARASGLDLAVSTLGFDLPHLRGELTAKLDVKTFDVEGDAPTHVEATTLALEASFAEQLGLTLTGTPGRAHLTVGKLTLDALPAPFTANATLDARYRLLEARATLPLRGLLATSAGQRLSVGAITHRLVLTGDPRDEASLRSTLGLTEVLAQHADATLAVDAMALEGSARLTKWKPAHLEGTLSHSGLRLAGQSADEGRLTFWLDADGADLAARLDGTLPPLTLHATANRRGPGLSATLRASATSLGVLAPLWPAQLGGVSLEPSTLGFDFTGAVELADLSRPTALSLDADLTVPRLVLQRDARRIRAESLGLHLVHRHGQHIDRGTLRLRLERPSVEEATLDGAIEANMTLTLDRARGTGSLRTTLDALQERTLALALDLRRERDGRLHHELEVDVAHLGPWAPLVGELSSTPPGLVLEQLTAHLVSHGDTLGLLDRDFMPAPAWQARSDTTFHAGLEVQHLVHHLDGEDTKAPRVSVTIDAGVLHGAVSLAARLEVPSLEVDVGTQHVVLTGVHQTLWLRSETDPDAGLLHLDLDGTIDELEQNLWPPWQPSAVHLTIDGSLDRLAALTIDSLRLESPASGTRLELSKKLRGEGAGSALDAAAPRLQLQGKLTQDLSKLGGAPLTFQGQGTVAVGLSVQSADLSLFRVRGKVDLTDVGVTLPARHFIVEGATGSVPFEEAFTLDPTRGVQLVIATPRSAFNRARSKERQPMPGAAGALSLRRLRWKDLELSPVVASLELEPNRFSLHKLKAERGNARIAGQLFVDFRPGEEVVTFRGTLTGLERKGAATPLDANAAFTFLPRRLELDGRVQVVRTSKEHLLDLLDVIDPHHEVGSLNQVRSAMALGYPRAVQLDFSDGLLSMNVAFGGLAGLFDLGTVRGVSLGPFLNRYLAPALRSSP